MNARTTGWVVALVVFAFAASLVGVGLWKLADFSHKMMFADRLAAVRKTLDAQQEAWNRGDLDGFMAGYWRDERLEFVSGDKVTRGWQATYDRYKARYRADGREMGRLDFSDLAVVEITPDHTTISGRWRLTMKDGTTPSGGFQLDMKWYEGAGYLIVRDTTTSDQP